MTTYNISFFIDKNVFDNRNNNRIDLIRTRKIDRKQKVMRFSIIKINITTFV